jgi:nucleoside-diphosphate-sugar epimerase
MSLVLLTGSSGMMGREIISQFTDHEIVCYKHGEELPDIKPEFIIHCAAISSQAYNPNNEVFEANLLLTQRIIEKYGDVTNPPVFIFPSSIAVYGTCFYPKEETDCCRPTTLYAISKLAAEHMISFYTGLGKINGISFRLSALVGDRTNGPVYDILQKTLNDNAVEVFGFKPGTQKTYTAVWDVVNFMKKFVDGHIYGNQYGGHAYNLCVEGTISIEEIALYMQKYLDKNKPIGFNQSTYFGDNSILAANSNLAMFKFGWRPKYRGMEVIRYGCDVLMSR